MPYIQVSINQGTEDISIIEVSIHNRTTDIIYTCREGDCPFPVHVDMGDQIKVKYICENTGDSTLYIWHYIALIDPLGAVKVESWNPEGECPAVLQPGWQFGRFNDVLLVLDVEGLWVVHAIVVFET